MKRRLVNRVRKRLKKGAATSSAQVGDQYPATPGALEVKMLQEKVNHLAVEVFHLTTELDEVRHLLSTLVAGAVVPASQSSSTPATAIPESAFSELPAGIGLESFPSERAAPEHSKTRVHEASAPAAAVPGRPTNSPRVVTQKAPPRSARRARVLHATKVTGLAALLIAGLGKAGDPIASMSDNPSSTVPSAAESALGTPEQHTERPLAFQVDDDSGTRPKPASPPTRLTPATQVTPDVAPAVKQRIEPRTPRLSVSRVGVGTGVVGREVVGRSDTFRVGAAVVFWTHVRGGRRGDTIYHRWFHNGTLVADVVLPVDSPSWRTQSRYLLAAGAEGDWAVELRDGQNNLLATQTFHCEG